MDRQQQIKDGILEPLERQRVNHEHVCDYLTYHWRTLAE